MRKWIRFVIGAVLFPGALVLAQQTQGPTKIIGDMQSTTVTSTKVSPIPFGSAIVISGDSICANTPGLRWTDLIMSMSQFAGRIAVNHNTCIAGRTIEQVAAAYASEVAIYKPATTGISPTYLFVESGTNSLADGIDSAATAYAAQQAYWAQALNDGFVVIAMTVLPRGSYSGGAFTSNNIETYNSLVRAGLPPGADPTAAPPSPALYSMLFDMNTVLSDPYDPVVFSIENGLYVHPNYSAHVLMALAANHLFGGAAFPVQATFTGRRGSYDFTCDYSGLAPSLNSGIFDLACGVKDLTANTTGSYNTALGADAMPANTTGSNNTAAGAQALFEITTGIENVGVGNDALLSLVTGSDNTGLGFSALFTATGSSNTAVGSKAGKFLSTGSGLTALGALAGYLGTTDNFETAIGVGALETNVSGNDNTAVGYNALLLTTVSDNTAVGYQALTTDSTGTDNTAVGTQAMRLNTSGSDDTALGFQAGYNNTTGIDLTAAGYDAATANTTGADNTGLGFAALLTNQTGADNTAVGASSLYNVTSSNNTALGQFSGRLITTGDANTMVGVKTLYNAAGGAHNTAVGFQAGAFQADGSTALVPNNCIYLGYAVLGLSNSDTNCVVIGYNAVGQGANTTVLGAPATAGTFIYGIQAHPSQTAIASASTIAPTAQFFHVSGTTTINTITAPAACAVSGFMCQLTLIPDGLWATGTSGNIAIASTAVVSKALIMTYDPTTTKWYPSY
jgi:hypothetical protein